MGLGKGVIAIHVYFSQYRTDQPRVSCAPRGLGRFIELIEFARFCMSENSLYTATNNTKRAGGPLAQNG